MSIQSTIAEHEIAHGIMRWSVGLPATAIHCSKEGGLCEGTGRRIRPEDALLITLAGFAYEAGCGAFGAPDLDYSGGTDFDEAREILANCERLRMLVKDGKVVAEGIDAALEHWFLKAGERLAPHREFIERVGCILADTGHISARRYGALLREYDRTFKKSA